MPFRVARSTSATTSTNVLLPGVRQVKVIRDVERMAGPSSSPVRSTSMS